MSLFYESDVIGAKQAFVVIATVSTLAVGSYVAKHSGEEPADSDCNNPLLHGPYEMTIKRDANARKTPVRHDSIGDNLAGEPLTKTVTFTTKDIGTICIADNGQGTWYGFNEKDFQKLTGEAVEGNKHNWVWVNKDQNITSEFAG